LCAGRWNSVEFDWRRVCVWLERPGFSPETRFLLSIGTQVLVFLFLKGI